MKEAFIYSLKVWLTSSLLAITVTSFYYYAIYYKSLATFGATGWIPAIIADYWEGLELGLTIIWLIMLVIIPIVNRSASTNMRKRATIFLIAESQITLLLIVFGLLKDYRHFLPGLFMWVVCSFALAFSMIIFRLDKSATISG